MGRCGRTERRERRRVRRARYRGEMDAIETFDEGGTLYRSRDGMIFGVCRGIADHYGFSVFWIRMLFVAGSFFTGFWPAIGVYLVAAFIMKLEPVLPLESEEDEEFYHSYSTSRSMALHRLKRTYDNLDRRLQRLEGTVTARDYDWEERLHRG